MIGAFHAPSWDGLSPRVRSGGLDRGINVGEAGEVLVEAAGEPRGLLVVGVRVGPRRARVEDLARDAGAGLRRAEAEDRVDGEGDVAQLAVHDGIDQGPRVRQGDPAALAEPAAGPAGV